MKHGNQISWPRHIFWESACFLGIFDVLFEHPLLRPEKPHIPITLTLQNPNRAGRDERLEGVLPEDERRQGPKGPATQVCAS